MSHMVAILPVRRWLPASALAIGAVVPDAPYYLPLPFSSANTHTWWGALLLGVPVGVALLLLFHLGLRKPLTALAPAALRARLPGVVRPAPVAVVAALLAGMATHLVWDAFTQAGGYAVAHWQALRQPVAGAHRVFNVLMYASSAGRPARPGRLAPAVVPAGAGRPGRARRPGAAGHGPGARRGAGRGRSRHGRRRRGRRDVGACRGERL
ncbi:DUF4184 family protein [Nonomuraea sp. NPDC023979]|uniref:DUF4184 family protein n=1 Tax=Nonomuraea sp. NPDC023979 TaxID=3154796 RepID=UPI0033C2850F